MFIGTFERSVEVNGRLTLPPAYREAVRRSPFSEVIARPSLANLVVDTYVADGNGRVKRFGDFEDVKGEPGCSMLDGACRIRMDVRGRIVLPKRLRLHAAIDKMAVIIGLGDYFKICADGYLQIFRDKEFDRRAQQSAIEALSGESMIGTG